MCDKCVQVKELGLKVAEHLEKEGIPLDWTAVQAFVETGMVLAKGIKVPYPVLLAYIASALQDIFPAENRELAKKVAEGLELAKDIEDKHGVH